MTRAALSFCAIILCLLAVPAAAGGAPGSGGLPPIYNPHAQLQRRILTAPVARAPYAMTYSDQVAQSLGVRNGGVALFESRDSARNPYTPSVSLGGGSMIRLRWGQ